MHEINRPTSLHTETQARQIAIMADTDSVVEQLYNGQGKPMVAVSLQNDITVIELFEPGKPNEIRDPSNDPAFDRRIHDHLMQKASERNGHIPRAVLDHRNGGVTAYDTTDTNKLIPVLTVEPNDVKLHPRIKSALGALPLGATIFSRRITAESTQRLISPSRDGK